MSSSMRCARSLALCFACRSEMAKKERKPTSTASTTRYAAAAGFSIRSRAGRVDSPSFTARISDVMPVPLSGKSEACGWASLADTECCRFRRSGKRASGEGVKESGARATAARRAMLEAARAELRGRHGEFLMTNRGRQKERAAGFRVS
eukprot:scaffold3625_cov79-Phaeocystis_antarctica.AAC.4